MFNTYSYYYRYFISFVLASAYSYSTTHTIPKLNKLKLELTFYNNARLANRFDLQYLSFLLKTTTFFTKIHFKKVTFKKQGFYKFFVVLGTRQWQIFERFLFFSYPYSNFDPIPTLFFSNDFVRLNANSWRTPETSFYRPGEWTTQNVFDFNVKSTLSVKLLPYNQSTLYEQRNLLRLLNVPFRNK